MRDIISERFETDRELVIAVWAMGVGISLGMWIGLWTVPAEALSVPTTPTEYGTSRPAYRPVSSPFLAGPVLFLGVAWLVSRRIRQADEEIVDVDDVEHDVQEASAEPGGDVEAVADGGRSESATICKMGCRPIWRGDVDECPRCGSEAVRTGPLQTADDTSEPETMGDLFG